MEANGDLLKFRELLACGCRATDLKNYTPDFLLFPLIPTPLLNRPILIISPEACRILSLPISTIVSLPIPPIELCSAARKHVP